MKKRKFKLIFLILIFIFSLSSCGQAGPQGPQGEQGIQGETGIGIESIEKSGSEGLVDTYTITFSDGTTSTFTVTNGKDGVNGNQGIQGIQGEPGEDGHTPVITIQDGYWYIDGVNTLQLAQGVKGDTGNGISSITKTNTSGLIDTYTITYTDGTTSTFIVTNGKDGEDGIQGIQGIQGVPGEDGHTPVITIQDGYWYIDGVNTLQLAQGPKGENGTGILSVEFNEQGQLVITLTDGTVLEPIDFPEKEEHIHTFTEWESIKEPTCEDKGIEFRFCEECNYTESKFIEALGHNEVVTKKELVPTNDKTGLSEQIECIECGEVLQKQKVLAPKGYEWMLEDTEIKILMCGNSFTEDASNSGQGVVDSQLYSIIQSMVGPEIKVTIATIVSGGKGLNWHASQAYNEKSCYTLKVISTDNPKWKNIKTISYVDALKWNDWDIISLQPYDLNTSNGHESNAYSEQVEEQFYYIEDSTNYLLDLANQYASQAEVYCYMHWARSSASVSQLNASLSKYNNLASYFLGMLDYCSTTGKRYSGIVPVALSIQNARTTYLSTLSYNVGQTVNYNTDPQIGLQRDGGHLTFNVGRYIAALTFAEYLIPEEIRTSQYTIPDIRITESIGRLPKEYTTIAQQSVSYAINSWKEGNLQVTNIEGYEKDPTTLFAEKFNEDLYVDFEITEENVEIYLEDYLLEDMVLENVVLSKNEDVYEVEATVRFGYTILKVDISLLLDITYIPKEEIDFSNLTYTAFGDSITYGADLIIGGRVDSPYPTLVSNILGLKSYENKGVNGATIVDNTPNTNCITDTITSFSSKTDIIGVLGGVNDFYRNLPLGDIDDTDTSTIYGSLHVSMKYLSENYSDSFVFYMTPYKCYFNNKLWSDNNTQGYNLEDVANAIKEVSEIYDIPVLDLLEYGDFESVMYDDDCDGVHPNQNFITNVMAPQIAQFIKDNYK